MRFGFTLGADSGTQAFTEPDRIPGRSNLPP